MRRDTLRASFGPVLRLGRFLGHVLRRFQTDRCLPAAATLSYTSLFACVPLVAIVLSVLSAFPLFDDLQDEIERAIFLYLAPHVSDEAQAYFRAFLANTRQLTALGVGGLGVSAIILLLTVEEEFNVIWRTRRGRRLRFRLLAYIGALLLGPLLVGGALSLSTALYALVALTGIPGLAGPAARLTPFGLTAAGFALIYLALPNRRVRPGDALAGALVAAVLFELLKSGFGLYVRLFPAYQTIYGALSVVPIFLVWMYLAWAAVLFGAEITAGWPEWRAATRAAVGPDRPLVGA